MSFQDLAQISSLMLYQIVKDREVYAVTVNWIERLSGEFALAAVMLQESEVFQLGYSCLYSTNPHPHCHIKSLNFTFFS